MWKNNPIGSEGGEIPTTWGNLWIPLRHVYKVGQWEKGGKVGDNNNSGHCIGLNEGQCRHSDWTNFSSISSGLFILPFPPFTKIFCTVWL